MKTGACVCIVSTFVFINSFSVAASLPHAPHTGDNSVTCLSCHDSSLPATDRSAICSNVICHGIGSPLELQTHSAAVIHEGEDPVDWPYGNWQTVCLDCHDPHLHFQLSHLSQLADGLYLIQGKIDTIGTDLQNKTTTITYSAPVTKSDWDLPAADWGAKTFAGRGLIFIADKNNPRDTFEISSADAMQIILNGLMDQTLIDSLNAVIADPEQDAEFGVIYGQLVKSDIASPNTGNKMVTFFDPNGGFVDGNDDPAPGGFVDESGASTPEGVCQICHTATKYWREDGSGDPHPDDGTIKCNDCHDHAKGFAASCDSCHGFPPGSLVWNPDITNSSTAGAHDAHVGTQGFGCTDCHYSSVGSGSTHNSNLTITMGFYSFDGAAQGGGYNGQSGVLYDTTLTNPVTSVINPATGLMRCSNIYCHSNGTSVSTGIIPANTSAQWNAGTQACTACHAFPPLYDNGSPKANSHVNHMSNKCETCHYGVTTTGNTVTGIGLHVNHAYDVQAGPDVSFTYSYGPGGGTCASISCHNGDSAVWGNITPLFACNSCHGYPPVPGDGLNVNEQFDGGKGAHVTSSYDPGNWVEGGHIIVAGDLDPDEDLYGTEASGYYECSKCHYGGVHANGIVDVQISTDQWYKNVPWGDGLYNRGGFGFDGLTPEYQGVPGDTLEDKRCSNVSCHSGQITPEWSCPLRGGE